MTRALFLLAAVVAVLAVAYPVVGYVVAARLSSPRRRTTGRTPADVGLDYEAAVRLRSEDGLDLAAWWVEGGNPSRGGGAPRAAVLVHGYGDDRSSDYVLETAPIYARAGFGVLMIDLRGHGGSEGDRITMGQDEPRDVRAALSWLAKRGYESENVVLHGWSMGGAVVLRAAPGTGVAAVVEEAAYADLLPVLRKRLPEASGLPAFFTPGVVFAGEVLLGIEAREVRPEEEARRLSEEGTPLMVVHSPDDDVVPFRHAEAIAAAHPGATLWRIPGYGHVAAHAHPEYEERLSGFLERAVAPASEGPRGGVSDRPRPGNEGEGRPVSGERGGS